MKTKKTMRTLSVVLATIFAASMMMFSSCSQSPDSYQDEIEDYVKFTVAKNKFIVDCINSGNFNYMSTVDAVFDALDNDSTKACEEILEEMRDDEDCNAILTHYNSTSIVLTEYQKDTTEIENQKWTFTEEKSGIDFEFILYEEGWLCEAIADTEEKYIEDNSPLYKYEDEIEDIVKYSIAMSDLYIADMNEFNKSMNNPLFGALFYTLTSNEGLSDPYENFQRAFEKFENVVIECYQQDSLVTTYNDALDKLSENKKSKHNERLVRVLENYNATDIILSNYMPISMNANVSAWQFAEVNTGIEFIFKYDAEEGYWDCIANEESVNLYINKRI